jgi:glycine N-methyltransferase
MVDSVYRTRSLGVPATGLPDQYADGKAAKVWQHYIGGHKQRTEAYQEFFCGTFRKHNLKRILDVACGTG